MSKSTLNLGGTYFDEGPFCISFQQGMYRAFQEQYNNNEDARVVRFREVHCPYFGDLNSRNDQIALSVEDSRYRDDALADVLGIDITEALQIWEGRPISLFDCLEPSCRTPLPVRNRTHLLRLLRMEKYFNVFVGADDPVEFAKLATMLCDGCAQGLQHSYEEQRRAEMCIRQARVAQLEKMPHEEYWLTREWRALRNRVLIRSGKQCELCPRSSASEIIQVHHKTYERYGQEHMTDLIALCRECHARHHNVLPEEAA